MAKYNNLIFKTKGYNLIKDDVAFDRLSHCYMLTCHDREFLCEFLATLQQLVVCQDKDKPCSECNSCLRAAKGKHPDVLVYPKNSKKIVVEDINNIIRELHIKPVEGEKKFYFLYDFDEANFQSQNKLLKTLEEPPQNVYIFLGALSEHSVLPTIKSRAKNIAIDSFSDADIYDYILKKYNDKNLAEIASSSCNGQIGVADKIASDKDYLEMYNAAFTLLSTVTSSRDILKGQAQILKYKNRLLEFLGIVQGIAGDVVRVKNNASSVVLLKHKLDKINNIADIHSTPALLFLINEIESIKDKLRVNCNLTILVDMLLYNFLEVRHKCQK